MFEITIGQYFPGESFLHRLDPRVKLVLTFVFTLNIFTAKSLYSLVFNAAALLFMIFISSIPLKIVFKGIKPILPMVLFTSFLNIFYGSGDVIFTVLFLHVTRQGILSAEVLTIRILCIITCSALLTYTTSMSLITHGLEELMTPLKRFNVPVNEAALVITLALRFIPTITEEINKIINAQKARGADFETGSIIKRIKSYFPVIIPLFMSSFRRAYDLVNALECRCYNGGNGRTKMREFHISSLDYIAILFFIIVFAITIYLNKV